MFPGSEYRFGCEQKDVEEMWGIIILSQSQCKALTLPAAQLDSVTLE